MFIFCVALSLGTNVRDCLHRTPMKYREKERKEERKKKEKEGRKGGMEGGKGRKKK